MAGRCSFLILAIILLVAACESPTHREQQMPVPQEQLETDTAVRENHCALDSEAAEKVRVGINRLRSRQRSMPLIVDAPLMAAAQDHARFLLEKSELTHAGQRGAGPAERLENLGLTRRFVAENLARFQHREDPHDYVLGYWWEQNQEGENMILSRYHRMGFAFASDADHCVAVLLLTN